MKQTYSVKALMRIDTKKKDGQCRIDYFVRVGNYVTKLPTGKSIHPKDWDVKNKCPKLTTKNGIALNMFFIKQISEFNEYALKQETMGQTITTNFAIAYFKKGGSKNFFEYWAEQIVHWEHDKEYNTLKSYRSTLNVVREFRPKLNFGDLSRTFIMQFDHYLASTRGNSIGGRFTKHKCLKSIINNAIIDGYLQENPYKFFKIKSAEGKRMFLKIDEVVKLIDYEIPEEKGHLIKIKDMFLFSCFSGLRYSDVVSLKKDCYKVEKDQHKLEITIKKTKRVLEVPLTSMALAILQSYMLTEIKNRKSMIFPNITNQALNRELKDLIKLAEIEKDITFHCARHTFACNHIENGTPPIIVKELLGHTDMKNTMIYTKVTTEHLYDSVSTLDHFFTSKLKK